MLISVVSTTLRMLPADGDEFVIVIGQEPLGISDQFTWLSCEYAIAPLTFSRKYTYPPDCEIFGIPVGNVKSNIPLEVFIDWVVKP